MKDRRQARILELVANQAIETQEELAACLESVGFKATQATVSRDIKELGLIKVMGKSGRQLYTQSPTSGGDSLADRLVRILRNAVTHMDHASHFIIIKTFSGGGNAAAAALDSLQLSGVMGTIAGDDTVMVIVKDAAETAEVVTRLERMLERQS
ncbi:MAG TPA: arginine repressor [Bacillota bacterium]|nr:arginine repressor [Bacillota bacterium]